MATDKYCGIYKDKFGLWKVYVDEYDDVVVSDSPDVVKSRLKRVHDNDRFIILKQI